MARPSLNANSPMARPSHGRGAANGAS
jgi:hypothetical protein